MSESARTPTAVDDFVAMSADAILRLGPDEIITAWNPAAEAIYGFNAAQAIGLPFRSIVPFELHEIERRRVRCAMDGECTRVASAPRLRRDGAHVVVASTMIPLRNDQGEIIGVGAIERDITSERAMEAEL